MFQCTGLLTLIFCGFSKGPAALEGPFITILTSGLLMREFELALLDPMNETLGETDAILFTKGDATLGNPEVSETEFVITGDIVELLDKLAIPECSNEFCKFFRSEK